MYYQMKTVTKCVYLRFSHDAFRFTIDIILARYVLFVHSETSFIKTP